MWIKVRQGSHFLVRGAGRTIAVNEGGLFSISAARRYHLRASAVDVPALVAQGCRPLVKPKRLRLRPKRRGDGGN